MVKAPEQKGTLKNRLLKMMFLRVFFMVLFLGTIGWFQLKVSPPDSPPFYPIYAIIVIIALLTIVYSILFRWMHKFKTFAYAQLFVDILLVTTLVYITGGLDSFLLALYFLAIIGGSMILGTPGGFYAASIASIAYALLVYLDFYQALPIYIKVFSSGIEYTWTDLLTTVATNVMAFFAVAYLTGYLSERANRVEKKLEEREVGYKRLETMNKFILENINTGILTINRDSNITSFNKTAEKLTGFKLQDIYYMDIDDIFPDLKNVIKNTKEEAFPIRIEQDFTRKDGVPLFLGFSITTAGDINVDKIIIFQDLTRIREMEEQLKRDERLKSLGGLAAGMAHEIRNPLASMSGSIQVLKESLSNNDKENEKLMDIILNETERLNELITDFLLFAKPASKDMDIIDLKALIVDILKVFMNNIEAKGLNLTRSLTDGIYISGNGRQLRQAFWNLFLNAQQSMPAGGRLEVRSEQVSVDDLEHSGNTDIIADVKKSALIADITVSDSGVGIDTGDIGKIFDPFFTSRESGTGLGLALVHKIIENHGGRIAVNSKKGMGTTFRIRLPVLKDLAVFRNKALLRKS